ncbi:MAG TPA: SUF system Fe-S cluster assembly regulator [Mariprofundaceae bacterium]|nr:SUF system Fe-S cluster assembly regulator [Mariprofundaceae bacterium]
MFRITKLADYGVLLMAQFARDAGKLYNAAELAELAHLPQPTVSKILQILLREGMLESVRGVNGGYRLTRSPQEISIRDIIVAMEGPIALTECNLEDGSHCEQESSCSIRGNWQRINHAIRDALGHISLSDMLQPQFAPAIQMQKGAPGEGSSFMQESGA